MPTIRLVPQKTINQIRARFVPQLPNNKIRATNRQVNPIGPHWILLDTSGQNWQARREVWLRGSAPQPRHTTRLVSKLLLSGHQ